jgi:hypothetical protein
MIVRKSAAVISIRGTGYIVSQINWSLARMLWRGFRGGAGTPRLRGRRVMLTGGTTSVGVDRIGDVRLFSSRRLPRPVGFLG